MDTSNIKVVLIVIETDEGRAHQVLASAHNKMFALKMLAGLQGGLKLDKELVPFTLELKQS